MKFNSLIGKQAVVVETKTKKLAEGFRNHFSKDDGSDEDDTNTDAVSRGTADEQVRPVSDDTDDDTSSLPNLSPRPFTSTTTFASNTQYIPRASMTSTANIDERYSDDLQEKLTQIWTVLEVPFPMRINFMRKYSTDAYATEMSRAIDIWGEVAVCAAFRKEFLKLFSKHQVRTIGTDSIRFNIHTERLLCSAISIGGCDE